MFYNELGGIGSHQRAVVFYDIPEGDLFATRGGEPKSALIWIEGEIVFVVSIEGESRIAMVDYLRHHNRIERAYATICRAASFGEVAIVCGLQHLANGLTNIVGIGEVLGVELGAESLQQRGQAFIHTTNKTYGPSLWD